MYIFARLIGIGIYTIVMFGIGFLIYCTTTSKGIRTLITIYWVILGIMGFFFVPPSGFDLPILIVRMREYGSYTFEDLLVHMKTVLSPSEYLYYWFVEKLGDARWLPCISGLISMGFCFSILKDHTKKDNTKKEIALALLLFMARGAFMMAIDTIRAFMATAIIVWCFYQESVNKKSVVKHLPLYVIIATLHSLGFVCVVLRFVFWIIDSEKKLSRKVFRIVGGGGLLGMSFLFFGRFWELLFSKADYYYQEGQTGTGYSYIWEGVLSALVICVTLYTAKRIQYYRKKSLTVEKAELINEGYEKLRRFSLFVVVVDILCAFVEFNIYMRLSCVLLVLNIPLTLYMLRFARYHGKQDHEQSMLALFGMAIFALAASRGYLCSLKFFE